MLSLDCLSSESFDINVWLNSRYESLPSILQATRAYAENEPLPEIRQARSAGIPEAMDLLHEMVQYAFKNKKHLLAFVTGVPGAGKTLLGLQLVYKETEHSTLFLSGNDPLVEVLRYTLKSKSLANRIYNIKNEKNINRNVIVFDEGQRAWPEEPKLLINLMTQCLEWGVLLILVGEGQDIHRKEHESLQPWADALAPGWDVACPSKLAPLFNTAKFVEDKLDLTVSLHSHTAGQVSNFVNDIISGDTEEAKRLRGKIGESFPIYVTTNLSVAMQYCIDRYKGEDALLFPRPHAGRQDHLPEPEEAPRALRVPALRRGRGRQGWQASSRTSGLRPQQEQAQRLPCLGLNGPDTVRRRDHPDLWQALEHRGLLQNVQVLPESGQRDKIHLLRRPDRSHGHCLRTLHDACAGTTAQYG